MFQIDYLNCFFTQSRYSIFDKYVFYQENTSYNDFKNLKIKVKL